MKTHKLKLLLAFAALFIAPSVFAACESERNDQAQASNALQHCLSAWAWTSGGGFDECRGEYTMLDFTGVVLDRCERNSGGGGGGGCFWSWDTCDEWL